MSFFDSVVLTNKLLLLVIIEVYCVRNRLKLSYFRDICFTSCRTITNTFQQPWLRHKYAFQSLPIQFGRYLNQFYFAAFSALRFYYSRRGKNKSLANGKSFCCFGHRVEVAWWLTAFRMKLIWAIALSTNAFMKQRFFNMYASHATADQRPTLRLNVSLKNFNKYKSCACHWEGLWRVLFESRLFLISYHGLIVKEALHL